MRRGCLTGSASSGKIWRILFKTETRSLVTYKEYAPSLFTSVLSRLHPNFAARVVLVKLSSCLEIWRQRFLTVKCLRVVFFGF